MSDTYEDKRGYGGELTNDICAALAAVLEANKLVRAMSEPRSWKQLTLQHSAGEATIVSICERSHLRQGNAPKQMKHSTKPKKPRKFVTK